MVGGDKERDRTGENVMINMQGGRGIDRGAKWVRSNATEEKGGVVVQSNGQDNAEAREQTL